MSLSVDIENENQVNHRNRASLLEEHLFLNQNTLDKSEVSHSLFVTEHSTVADKLKALVDSKKLYRKYRNSFDINQPKTFIKAMVGTGGPILLISFLTFIPHFPDFLRLVGILSFFGASLFFFIRHFMHDKPHLLRHLKKGYTLQNTIAYYKELLKENISQQQFQFELLYCLKLLAQKLGNTNSTRFNGDWVMEQYESLKHSFYHEDYDKSCDTLALLHLHYHEMADVRKQKANWNQYEQELEDFIKEQSQQAGREKDLNIKDIESRLKDIL
jgi:hypothetical protein